MTGTARFILPLLTLCAGAAHALTAADAVEDYYKYDLKRGYVTLAVHTELKPGEVCSHESGPLMDTMMAGRLALDAACTENQWGRSSLYDVKKIDKNALCGAIVVVECLDNRGGYGRIPPPLALDKAMREDYQANGLQPGEFYTAAMVKEMFRIGNQNCSQMTHTTAGSVMPGMGRDCSSEEAQRWAKIFIRGILRGLTIGMGQANARMGQVMVQGSLAQGNALLSMGQAQMQGMQLLASGQVQGMTLLAQGNREIGFNMVRMGQVMAQGQAAIAAGQVQGMQTLSSGMMTMGHALTSMGATMGSAMNSLAAAQTAGMSMLSGGMLNTGQAAVQMGVTMGNAILSQGQAMAKGQAMLAQGQVGGMKLLSAGMVQQGTSLMLMGRQMADSQAMIALAQTGGMATLAEGLASTGRSLLQTGEMMAKGQAGLAEGEVLGSRLSAQSMKELGGRLVDIGRRMSESQALLASGRTDGMKELMAGVAAAGSFLVEGGVAITPPVDGGLLARRGEALARGLSLTAAGAADGQAVLGEGLSGVGEALLSSGMSLSQGYRRIALGDAASARELQAGILRLGRTLSEIQRAPAGVNIEAVRNNGRLLTEIGEAMSQALSDLAVGRTEGMKAAIEGLDRIGVEMLASGAAAAFGGV
ncbi:MAG: hypothetical protein M0011_00160 [Elusimicrobia bacterium]|nr:hypothetical protein [Elusimicrobiota bacterium]